VFGQSRARAGGITRKARVIDIEWECSSSLIS
jgi:hypothetical protein